MIGMPQDFKTQSCAPKMGFQLVLQLSTVDESDHKSPKRK